MSQSGRTVWSVVTAMAVGICLWSVAPGASVTPIADGCCQHNGSCSVESNSSCYGGFFPGQVCGDNGSCREPVQVGCCQEPHGFCGNQGELDCQLGNGTFLDNATCESDVNAVTSQLMPPKVCVPFTPTPTPVAATPTPTMIPDGASCIDPVDCVSGNCVDDVCCESACTGEMEACNLVGQEGICTAIAAGAPAASDRTLAVVLVMLLAIGCGALWFRRFNQV